MDKDIVKLAPSILSADFACLGEQVKEAEKAGADRIHVDVMDGHFVPNITIGPVVVQSLRPVTRLPLETHLMISEPDRYLEAFAEAGSTSLIVHYEGAIHLHRTVQRIRALGLPAGVAINPATPAGVLEEILPTLPLVHYRNLWDPALILKEILSAISRAKDELYDDKGYLALAEKMEEDAGEDEEKQIAAKKCLEIAAVYERYERAKADHKAMDFGDLIMGPTRLLENNKAIQAAVQLRHRHVVVDEYQDVNRASVPFTLGEPPDIVGRDLAEVAEAVLAADAPA